jgi:SAM-dependent methyltransferase
VADGAVAATAASAADDLARYYDLDLQDDPGDVAMYRALADRTGGPVLELAVGTGRVAIPLAEAGHSVTGVDIDRAALARADAAWRAANARGRLELVEHDLLDVRLDTRFGLAIIALNSLLLLGGAAAQRDALATLARHLQPEGMAVIDVWLPGPDDLAAYDGRLQLEWVRSDDERHEQVAKSASARYDAATAVITLSVFYDAWPGDGGPVRRVARTDSIRLVSAAELERMAADAGLERRLLAGDYDMSPFGPGAERAVLVAGLA